MRLRRNEYCPIHQLGNEIPMSRKITRRDGQRGLVCGEAVCLSRSDLSARVRENQTSGTCIPQNFRSATPRRKSCVLPRRTSSASPQ